nr:RNA-directed DNA polymerase, eukaryota, reverse transcriptase zinc-binding domain protein [Tanacetum cinerariifolium]
MGDVDINTEQYMALARGNDGPVVDEDAHEHVQRVLEIADLFHNPRVTHDAIMLRMFSITLTRASRRWKYTLPTWSIHTWDLLVKAFIRKYRLIPMMPPARALKSIQYMADHSQKCYDGATTRQGRRDSSNGIATITGRLDNLERDMRNLKEIIHAIHVGTLGYYTRMENRPLYGKKRTSLEEKVNRYLGETMKERAKTNQLIKKLKEGISTSVRFQLPVGPNDIKSLYKTSIRHCTRKRNDIINRGLTRQGSSDSSNGIATITNILDNLERDMRKLKDIIHAIHVGSKICAWMHLTKQCPLKEEGKAVEEVEYVKPISLIGSVYKVIIKILANRLAGVITDLVSDSQSVEIIAWCKRKNKQDLVFKVDFAKAYDSVRWDYLLDVLVAFGFGSNCPTSVFHFCCGLKQGDPLAPFRFIFIMESFHISVTRTVGDGVFKGLSIQGSDPLSHLFYADDVVFLGEWSETNLVNLVKILDCFHLAPGLKINLIKSQASKGVLLEMELIRNKFFIGSDQVDKKITWIDGIRCFRPRRKEAWVTNAIYGSNISSHDDKLSSNWCSIPSEIQVLKVNGFDFFAHCKKKVENGRGSRFLLDIWLLDKLFYVHFPSIFVLKTVSVATKWEAPSFEFSFRRHVRDGVETEQWMDLLSLINTVSLSSSNDRWIYVLNGAGVYRVKDIHYSLDDLFLPTSDIVTRWIKVISIKINVFVWRARLDRLLTRLNLSKRGFAGGGI